LAQHTSSNRPFRLPSSAVPGAELFSQERSQANDFFLGFTLFFFLIFFLEMNFRRHPRRFLFFFFSSSPYVPLITPLDYGFQEVPFLE